MKYTISAFTDEAGENIREQIKACKDNNICFIELRNANSKNLADLTLAEVKDIKNELDDAGIKVSAAGSPFGKTGIEEDFAPTLESFKRYVEKMHALDTCLLRLFSFYNTLGDPAAYKDEVAARIGLMMEAAPGIVFCHENERGIFGNIPERCKELYDAFGGRLKLVFDPANFVCDKVDVLGAFEMLEDYIEYFHIKDAYCASGEIVPAGCGDAKIADVLARFARFAQKDRDVYLSVEPHLAINDKGEAMAVKTGYIYDSKPEAFRAACSALADTLRSIGFRPTGLATGGVWENAAE